MKHLQAAHDWSFPVPIAYGPGRLAEIGRHCVANGIHRPLLVTDRGSRSLPFISNCLAHLEGTGLDSGLFCNISPNPKGNEIAAGREKFLQGDHDGVIAIGGGSGMDAGKAICLTANNSVDLWDFNFDVPSPELGKDHRFPPLVCVPTTSGTGAETDSTGMMTDTARGMKFCVWHPGLKPSLALLDPELTVGLPANLTAWTGVDALVHAIEAYCVPDFHPLCDGMALEAIRLISRWLERAVDEPDNLDARGGMQIGACLAGISFIKGLGLVHAISHMVGADYDTHHGLTNAVVLPAVLKFNAPAITGRIPAMAQAMDLKDTSYEGFERAINQLLDHLEIPRTLQDIGVPGDSAASLAPKAKLDAAAGTNPRQAEVEEIAALIEYVVLKGR